MTENTFWRNHGKIWPMGIPISQSWLDVGAILYTIQEFRIKTFIEIGVHKGGLASVLIPRTLYDDNFTYIGYEKDDDFLYESVERVSWLRDLRSMIFITDVFKLKNIIAGDAPRLVFCDGGDKPREFQKFAPLIRIGDFIMAHDYPREITEEDCVVEGVYLERIEGEWLEDTHLILFRKLP